MDRFQTLRRSRVQTLCFLGITTLGLWGLEHHGAYAQVVSAQDSIQTQVVQHDSQFDIVGGTLADEGTLLFHSFEQFDLGRSQIAKFHVAPGVDTVFSRIINGAPSRIDGMIAMGSSPASLYLMNPAGMLFGTGASINLAGDFTALTADRLDFTQGSFALVGNPTGVQGNVLQLHFNPEQPATIVNFGDLRVGEQQSLSLIGHSVVNLGTMGGGAVNIAAVGAHETVVFADGLQFGFAQTAQALPPWLTSEGTDHAAAIEIAEDGSLRLTGSPLRELPLGTAVVGGQLSATDQIQVLGSHDITINPSGDGALTVAPGSGSISFVADADGNGQGSFTMAPDDRLRASGQSIDITAADITVGELDTSAFSAIDNSRNAGDIRLTATQGSISAASLSSTARGTLNNSGNGGDIVLSAADTIVTGAITSATDALSNTGNAGKITLRATAGDIVTGSLTTHTSGNNNIGFGGDITLNALGRIVTDDITTAATATTNNSGMAGAISLISLSETITTDSLAADTSANSSNTGHGGDISLNAVRGAISAQEITSTTVSPDLAKTHGGDIQFYADGNIVIDSIDATGAGEGGDIEVVTQESIRVIETISGIAPQASLLTTGNGTIGLTYSSEPTVPFSLGNSDVHGTVGNIATGVDTLAAPQTVAQAVSLDTIELNNLFEQPPTPVVQPPVLLPDSPSAIPLDSPPVPQLHLLEPAEALIPSVESLNSSGIQTLTAFTHGPNEITGDLTGERQRAISNSELIWAQIEMAFSSDFVEALNLPLPPAPSLQTTQQALNQVSHSQRITPALMYVRLQETHVELVLVDGEGAPIYRPVPVTAAEVQAVVDRFHQTITNPVLRPAQYLPAAQQLFDWFVRPMLDDLETANIDHIGFIVDRGLRSLPLAALHDGNRFLIEDYSIGLLPSAGLTSMEPPANRDVGHRSTLAMGIAEFDQQPDLAAVPLELALASQSHNDEHYLDHEATLDALKQRLEQGSFTSVHLATHAVFQPGNLESSYVQLWEQALQLHQLQELPLETIEFLILSACATALGDHGAEFGFAGLAVNVGVQTALASLWSISDEGTLGLMSEFYRALEQPLTRSAALRQAQLAMLQGKVGIADGTVYGTGDHTIGHLPSLDASGSWDFSHPAYWSGFTMIGHSW